MAEQSTAAPAQPRSFVRDLVAIATSRVATQVATVCSGILIARLLGAGGKGLIEALLVAPAAFIALSELGVRQAAAYHIGQRAFPLPDIASTLTVMTLSSSVVAVLACLAYFAALPPPGADALLIALALAAIPLGIARSYEAGVFLGMQRIAEFNKLNWIPAVLRLSMIAAFTGWLGFGAYGVLGAGALSAAPIVVYGLIKISRWTRVRFAFHAGLAKTLVRLGFGYAALVFLLTILFKINIVILQRVGTLEDVGVYTVGANLAEYIWQIPAAMGALIFSRSANARDGRAFSMKVLMVFRLSLIVCAAAALFIAAAGRFVIPLVYGDEFRESATVLAAMLPGVTAFIGFKILNMDLSGKGKPWVALVIVAPTLVLSVTLGVFLAQAYGPVGAAASASIVYVVAAGAYVVLYCRVLKIRLSEAFAYKASDFTTVLDRLKKHFRPTARKPG